LSNIWSWIKMCYVFLMWQDGRTALHHAVELGVASNDLQMARLLLSYGADANIRDEVPGFLAVISGVMAERGQGASKLWGFCAIRKLSRNFLLVDKVSSKNLELRHISICCCGVHKTTVIEIFLLVLLLRSSYRYYGAVLPRRRPHYVSMLSVCLSVRPVPPPRGKTKRPRKTKLGRNGSWDTSTPWTNFKVPSCCLGEPTVLESQRAST